MLWQNGTSLCDIYKIVSDIFNKNMKMHMLIRDVIDLSYEEYRGLADDIIKTSPTETIEHFSLCMLVAWVAAYKHGRDEEYYEMMKSFVARMPQHHTSMVLDFVQTVCYDFQIDTFGPPIKTLKDIKRIAKIHAGM